MRQATAGISIRVRVSCKAPFSWRTPCNSWQQVANSAYCRCRSRALLLQLRLLRNCAALEPEVAGPGLLDTGLLEHVPQAVQALSAAEGEFFKGQRLLQGSSHVALFETCACSALKGSQDALVALAQLLANWAGSPEAATQMQADLFPQAWHALVTCHSGKHARDSCPAQVSAGTLHMTYLARLYRPCHRPHNPCAVPLLPGQRCVQCSALQHTLHPGSPDRPHDVILSASGGSSGRAGR